MNQETKNKIIEKLSLLQDTEELIRELTTPEKEQAETFEKTPINWKPDLGEEYFMVDDFGNILGQEWKGYSDDIKSYANFRVFKTEKEAETHNLKTRLTLKYLRRIEELNDGWVPLVSGEILNYRLAYDHNTNTFIVANNIHLQELPLEYYFSSKEIGRTLLAEFTEDELKLILL